MQKYAEAEKINIQALDARKKLLGLEHPDTISVVEHHALTDYDPKKCTKAEKLKIQGNSIGNKIYGPEDLTALTNLAITYTRLRKYEEAEMVQSQVIDARNRILGPEHLDTVAVMPNLALTYYKISVWKSG